VLDDPARLEEVRRFRRSRGVDRNVLDRLTKLVTALLDVPVSLISLVEADRQVFAGSSGLEPPWAEWQETPLTHSFCQHAVMSGAPLAIDDAREHPLVRGNAAIDDLGVVAYLGIPLTTSTGARIGSFCAIDSKPRAWTQSDVRVLEDLAATVIAYLEATASDAAQPASAGLNIAAVAQRTGVAADTLRKWERRYAILRPKRTAGGQRRYDDVDIARVEWLRDRLAEGYRIGEAAALLDRSSVGAPSSPEELTQALVEAVRAVDAARVVSLVEQAFTVYGVAAAVEEIATPALAEVAEPWRDRPVAIGEEHLLTQVLRSRLQRMLADRRTGVRGTAVLACAPDEQHDLGLLALAVLLQADGWLVAFLGADTPLEATVAVVEKLDAELLCLSATMGTSAERLQAELPGTLRASTRVVIGGAAAPQIPRAATVPRATRLANAVELLQRA